MLKRVREHNSYKRLVYFFPVQLLLVHIKKNSTLLIFWLILFGFITKSIAYRYGIPYLFLDPEYLDNVNIWSYLILGFSTGGFIMAFNISSYIMNSFRFPFLGTLSNPFIKYCVNNAVIPFIFVTTFIVEIILFQTKSEFVGYREVCFDVFGFLLGIALFIFIAFGYFFRFNKDIYKMFNLNEDDLNAHEERAKRMKTQRIVLKSNMEWKPLSNKESRDWHVETYLTGWGRIKLARGFDHYDKEMLKAVFRQNHFNAAIFEIVTFATIIILGLFREYPLITIPAGASVTLMLTMYLMLTSAMYSWFRGWSGTIFVGLFLVINFLAQYDSFHSINKAYGLDYNTKKATYSDDYLTKCGSDSKHVEADINATIDVLKKWKQKNCRGFLQEFDRPKLVLINVSGGGSRSSMWTVRVLQQADSMFKEQFFNHVFMITGSSGGMVGAAYYRELFLEQLNSKIDNCNDSKYLDNISKDILNPIAQTIAVNDLFFRFQKYTDGKNSYTKDRGYAFENKLNQNLDFVLDKRLRDYAQPERDAQIPMMVITPSIINDGRRLMISPLPVSYLTYNEGRKNIDNHALVEGVEFSRLFKEQDAGNLHFTTALRMSASFPYIAPITTLPSEPAIEVMDAGMRDNFGILSTLQFIHTFRDWIAQNTSGVVIIQMRDRKKEFEVEENPLNTVVQTLSSPIGSFYDNLFHIQDYNNDQLIRYCGSWFAGKIDVVNFQLKNNPKDRISLSWHLTTKEKKQILNSIYIPENKEAMKRLKDLLND